MIEKNTEWLCSQFTLGEAASAKDEIMLFPFGSFKHPQYGKLTFDAKFFGDIIRNFTENVLGVKPFIDREHQMGEAVAWMDEAPYVKDGIGLFIKPMWTALGEKLLGEKIYRYFSPWFEDFTDATGKTHKNVLRGGAVTNIPFLKTMPSILDENISLSDTGAITIKLSELTDAASDTRGGNADDGNKSQSVNADDGTQNGGQSMAEKMISMSKVCALLGLPTESEEKDVYDKMEAVMKSKDAAMMSEKTLSEKHDKLQGEVIALTKQLSERDCKDVIDGAIAAGKVLPKDREVWAKRYLADPVGISEIVAILPVSVKLDEQGSDGQGEATVLDETPSGKLFAEANKIMTERKIGTFSQALGILCTEKPELYAAYEKSRIKE